ncbi:PP2C family protein-serine/threonine phosphatase [Arthrobacter psychrolactophilus]
MEEGDRILVCSDGLTGELSDEQIHETLTTVADPQEAVDSLIQASLRSGGRDNITIVLVDAHLSEMPGAATSTTDPATAQLSHTTALPTAAQAPAVTHLHEENHG